MLLDFIKEEVSDSDHRTKDHQKQSGLIRTRQASRQSISEPARSWVIPKIVFIDSNSYTMRAVSRSAGDQPKKSVIKNRVAPEVEAAVVEMAIEQPAFGQVRRTQEEGHLCLARQRMEYLVST